MTPRNMPMHEGRMLPSVSFSQLDLPQVISWEINEQYFLVVKVEMTGKHNMEFLHDSPTSDKKKVTGDFKIVSVKAVGHKPIDLQSLEQEEMEHIKAEALSGGL